MRKTYLSQMGKKQQQLNSLAKTAKKESKGEIFKMEGGKWEEIKMASGILMTDSKTTR